MDRGSRGRRSLQIGSLYKVRQLRGSIELVAVVAAAAAAFVVIVDLLIC